MNEEPEIIINGLNVGPGCAMTIRVAIETFATYLSQKEIDKVLGKDLTKNYWARIEDVRRAMGVIK